MPQVWQRTNLLSVLWNYCYDHLLVDTLAPGESFIDFIAVSEHARGKGLGSLLMRWAEQTSVAIMLQRLPDQAGQDLCRILLRVSGHAGSEPAQTSVVIVQHRHPDQAGQDLWRVLLRVTDVASRSHRSEGSCP